MAVWWRANLYVYYTAREILALKFSLGKRPVWLPLQLPVVSQFVGLFIIRTLVSLLVLLYVYQPKYLKVSLTA